MAHHDGTAAESVERLIDSLERLDDEDFRELAARWAEQDSAARQRGWRNARAIIERRDLDDRLTDAREAVGAWAGAAPTDFAGIEGLLGRPGSQVTGRHAAAPALLDAVVAMLAGDELAPDEQQALIRPWEAVAGYLAEEDAARERD